LRPQSAKFGHGHGSLRVGDLFHDVARGVSSLGGRCLQCNESAAFAKVFDSQSGEQRAKAVASSCRFEMAGRPTPKLGDPPSTSSLS
jgi:hypothetical protein